MKFTIFYVLHPMAPYLVGPVPGLFDRLCGGAGHPVDLARGNSSGRSMGARSGHRVAAGFGSDGGAGGHTD